jgi:hypothetical protein
MIESRSFENLLRVGRCLAYGRITSVEDGDDLTGVDGDEEHGEASTQLALSVSSFRSCARG